MPQGFSPLHLLAFILVLSLLLGFVQVGLLSIAFEKLGLSPMTGFSLLFASLFGSFINIPLFRIRSEMSVPDVSIRGFRLLRLDYLLFEGYTLIAVNVGGCLIPVGFSLFLLLSTEVGLVSALAGVGFVGAVSYLVSRPIRGLGIGMPVLVAPLGAALVALLLDPAASAPLAYIAGTLGVLIGADVLRLKDIRYLGTPMASIGGAGTFDGIFITGIVAVLLA